MACPQPDIFVKISKEFFEALCRFEVSGQERRILDVIILKTWGFHKKEAAIVNSEFRVETRLGPERVCRCIASLVEKNMIVRTGKKCASVYSVQKDYDRWQLTKRSIAIDENVNCSKNPLKSGSQEPIDEKVNCEQLTKRSIAIDENVNSIDEKVNCSVNAPIIVKENLKKCKDISPYPLWLDENLFSDFIEFRKKIKKPMTENAIKLAIGRLEKFRSEGLDVREIIENSILCGYQGLFPVKNNKKGKVNIDGKQDYSDACGFER